MCDIQFQLFPNLPRAVFLFHYLQTLKEKSTIHHTNSIVLVLLLEIIEKEEWGVVPTLKKTREGSNPKTQEL